MKKLILFSLVVLAACNTAKQPATNDLSTYIDPFIGTGGHGHTFPGPCMPFGLVQLSPETGTSGWDWCSGYHDTDSSIMGFAHTHLSGTGAHGLGDILFMPYTGEWKITPGTKEKPTEGYRSVFSHADEKASAGYYSVQLKSYNIGVELTATTHCGFHKYTFPQSDESNVIIDLDHGISDSTTDAWVEIVGKDAIRGFRRSTGWAPDQYIYFYAKFSKPFDEMATVADGKISGQTKAQSRTAKALVRFKTKPNEVIYAKVGISAVSAENALLNLNAEIKDWDFDTVKEAAHQTWNAQMQKIKVEGGTDAQKRTFYTALYHTLLVPYNFTDVNGEYLGMDKKTHKADGFTYYTLFSLWDTYRAAHPLYSIIAPNENNDFIKSFIHKYEESGRLPIWELHSNETWCMIGNHSIPVITDAYLKGYGNFDIQEAYKAMKAAADDTIHGMNYFNEMGYIPNDKQDNSVSITLEYAYDDWCIAQVAKKLGNKDDYDKFIKRAQYYKNLFDTQTGFMRGKDAAGKWRADFNPANVSVLGKDDFTEGNSWQFTFYVPQDVSGLMALYGGPEVLARKLDSLFSQPSVNNNAESLDVSGLIGQYAQGNEPSHQIAYMYNYVGQPYRTAEKARDIMSKFYTDKRDGLCGNEDCGQMSAWYIFSALGFYPVNPADGKYIIGSPIFSKTSIPLTNGKTFTVKANNVSDSNKYIQSATLNGKPYKFSFITHQDILNGGELVFEMGSKPSDWGTAEDARPVSEIKN